MARMPVASGRSIRGRVQACGGGRSVRGAVVQHRLRLAVHGLPRASITRPSSPSPTRSQRVVCRQRTRLPCRMPARSLSGYSSVSSLRKPITSASSGGPASRWISAIAPDRRRETGRRDRHAHRLRHAARQRRGHERFELFGTMVQRGGSRPSIPLRCGPVGPRTAGRSCRSGFRRGSRPA